MQRRIVIDLYDHTPQSEVDEILEVLRGVGLDPRVEAEVSHRTDSVACPLCGAEPGAPCVTPSGNLRPDYPHKARMQAWRATRGMKVTA